MCEPEPTPAVPIVALGWSLIQATSSLRFFAGSDLPADYQHRVAGQQRDRLEVAEQIIRQLVDRAVDDMRAPVAEAERVAVGAAPRDAADADGAGGAGDILDDDVLSERTAHRSANKRPTTSVGPPAANGTIMVIGRDG